MPYNNKLTALQVRQAAASTIASTAGIGNQKIMIIRCESECEQHNINSRVCTDLRSLMTASFSLMGVPRSKGIEIKFDNGASFDFKDIRDLGQRLSGSSYNHIFVIGSPKTSEQKIKLNTFIASKMHANIYMEDQTCSQV